MSSTTPPPVQQPCTELFTVWINERQACALQHSGLRISITRNIRHDAQRERLLSRAVEFSPTDFLFIVALHPEDHSPVSYIPIRNPGAILLGGCDRSGAANRSLTGQKR